MSGLIPKQFIVDLIDRADVVEVVGRRVQLKKAGKEFKACVRSMTKKRRLLRSAQARAFITALAVAFMAMRSIS